MGWDRFWKGVERASVVLGALGTLVAAFYAAASYYGWATPAGVPVKLPAHQPLTPLPIWPALALAAICVPLFAVGVGMIALRLRGGARHEARLQDKQNLRRLGLERVPPSARTTPVVEGIAASELPPDSSMEVSGAATWEGSTPAQFGPPRQRDAVLVLEEPRVQLTNAPNGTPALVESFIVIRNASAITLSECRIRLTRYRAGSHGGPIEAQIDPGGPKQNDYFTLKSGERRRIRISRRDLADVVNEPPHKVALEGGRFIEFGDDEQCFFSIRLTCNSKRVTNVTLEIATRAPEQVALNIVDQHLEQT